MKQALKWALSALAVMALIAAISLTYWLDERLGCDLADHAEDCIAHAAVALRNWFTAADYERFLVGGADHEAFMDKMKDGCIAHHKEQKRPLGKTDEQLGIFCGCWANNLSAIATAADLRYLARHEEPPAALAQRLDDLAPDCARLANSVGPKQPN